MLQIYQCLGDKTRLRILNLLIHASVISKKQIGASQVSVSRHLSYLKERGLVESHRHQNWMIYPLSTRRPQELQSNLKCLQDCVTTKPIFKNDLSKLRKILSLEKAREILPEVYCCTDARPIQNRSRLTRRE